LIAFVQAQFLNEAKIIISDFVLDINAWKKLLMLMGHFEKIFKKNKLKGCFLKKNLYNS